MSDEDYMALALSLARAQKGRTAENPAVGCVLIKNGEVIGRGATADGGRPHAETIALMSAGSEARDSTAYVTLEPCSHYGQTAPCANALIEAKIAACHIAVIDPDPRVHWRGAALLQEAGIDVQIGIGAEEAFEINADFFARVGRIDG
jgi:diaminohydroxyphosphoribosylaminopyrimidine deaminase/5-amino-6-(5-phosphoribosylamino)uracil reductase